MRAIIIHVDTMPNFLMETPWIMMILLLGRLKRVGIWNRINNGQVLIYMHAMVDITAGDYIGLDLLMPMRIPLKFRFLARHPLSYRDTLNIQISFDGQHWVSSFITMVLRVMTYTNTLVL